MAPAADKAGLEAIHYVDVPLRVRYADTDRMGIVYYGNYPAYFEIGRTEYMRAKGFVYRSLEEMGYYLVVASLEATYHSPATYDDLLIVKTGVVELKSRAVTFQYRIFKDETLVVQGRTRHICIDSARKSVTIPPALMDLLRNVNNR
jgi:acyl-CoA thioester hydrolase